MKIKEIIGLVKAIIWIPFTPIARMIPIFERNPSTSKIVYRLILAFAGGKGIILPCLKMFFKQFSSYW